MKAKARIGCFPCPNGGRAPRAVSQSLWSEKDREEWFSLGENHDKACRSPDFLRALHWPRTIMCDFLHGKSHGVPRFHQPLLGIRVSVYTNCETALAVRDAANPLTQPLGIAGCSVINLRRLIRLKFPRHPNRSGLL